MPFSRRSVWISSICSRVSIFSVCVSATKLGLTYTNWNMYFVGCLQPWSGRSHRLQTGVPKRGDNARVGRRLALALLWRCRRFRLKPDIISKIRTARSWIGVQHGISRATGKQHKAMCRACESVGYRHCLSPELSHHLDASGGDKVVWGNTPGAQPHAPVATASYINSLTAPLFWWHWFLKHE